MAQAPPAYNEKDTNPGYPQTSGGAGLPYPAAQAPYPSADGQFAQPGFAPAPQTQYNTPNQYGQPGQPGVPMQSMPIFNQPGGPVVAYQGTGLEYLSSIDTVNIFQVMHMEEVLIGWERNNEYKICDQQNQQFMTAKEETDCCNRQCCGTARPFTINLTTLQGQIPIQLTRDLRGQGCCCPCWLQEMEICCPPTKRIGTIKEKWTCFTPQLEVYDACDQLIYIITGECCYMKCCTDIPFKITTPDGNAAGEIVKHWGGCREMCGQANDFSVHFPPGSEVTAKALLLGTAFLIDYMFYEKEKNSLCDD